MTNVASSSNHTDLPNNYTDIEGRNILGLSHSKFNSHSQRSAGDKMISGQVG